MLIISFLGNHHFISPNGTISLPRCCSDTNTDTDFKLKMCLVCRVGAGGIKRSNTYHPTGV